jgi:phage protein D
VSIIRGYSEVYAPRYFLEANGKLATDIIPYVTKFEYEEEEGKSDKLTISVANPGLLFKDDARFKEGAFFRVRFGYLTDISDLKNAVIAHAKPDYGSGMPSIQMVAFGLTKAMNTRANPVNWGAISSSDVAKRIAAKNNYKLDEITESNDSRRQSRVQPAGMTDFQFLLNLAKKLNWDCYVEGDQLHFHKKKYDAVATLEFQYFTDGVGTLLKFSPDVNMTKPNGVEVASADNKHGTSQSGGGDERMRNWNQQEAVKGAMFYRQRRTGGEAMSHPSSETDPKVVAAHGLASAQKVDMNAVKATAEMIGTPRLAARTMVRFTGIDQQYSGNWRVSKVKHSIDPKGVYKTHCNLKRDAAKKDTAAQNKHDGSGSLSRHREIVLNNSSFGATVYSVK